MRLALISDQHANDVAFQAVVEDVQRIGADALVCLGDAVQGGAQPAETLERLMSLDCPTVLGNADAFLFGADVAEETTPQQAEVRAWTLEQIGDAGVERLAPSSPPWSWSSKTSGCSAAMDRRGRTTTFSCPRATADLDPWLVDADLLAGGHTHRQWTRRIGEALFVNPGSVGLAYDHHRPEDEIRFAPVAEYALVFLDGRGPAVEFRRVGYDLGELREAVLASGRPYGEEHLAVYEP